MNDIRSGMVKIINGKHKGKIAYYDDDEMIDDQKQGIVYFGNPVYSQYYLIPLEYLSNNINANDLVERQNEIQNILMMLQDKKLYKNKLELISELLYTETLLNEKYTKSRYLESNYSKKVFLSHSSKDKTFVRILATDLIANGQNAWLDEWEIIAGESIPNKVSQGLDECDYVIIVLSKNAIESKWVEKEWESMYWDEVNNGKMKVIPVVIDNCIIPRLLVTKKYVDFRIDYNHALEEVLMALK